MPISIICKVDEDEEIRGKKMEREINVNSNEDFTYTFWKDDLKKLPDFFQNTALDLLYISLFVFAVDRTISRESGDDCWQREIVLKLPVLEIKKWNKCQEQLERMLEYLSGDKWSVEFRSRDLTEKEITYKNKIEEQKEDKLTADKLCMFSGGLDSFIGLVDLLEEKKEDVLLVSHYGGGKGVLEYQEVLREAIIREYGISDRCFSSFYASAIKGVEDTTRTRSFMFFSHAIALASCMPNAVDLIIPENGLISLNIPLTNSRLGSSSTRTTHPYYMKMLQELLRELGIRITIKNPYQFKTKGEMMRECKNTTLLQALVGNTMSCSHPDVGRMQGLSETRHCGYCLPCVIRRAAILASGFEDTSNYGDKDFEEGETAKVNLRSYQLGLKRYDAKKAFLMIQQSGPLEEKLDEYASLYRRGMEELRRVLEPYG